MGCGLREATQKYHILKKLEARHLCQPRFKERATNLGALWDESQWICEFVL